MRNRLLFFLLIVSAGLHAQHQNRIHATLDADAKTFSIRQEIIFHNQTNDTLRDYILNDWTNAYSGKETPLAKRFSDEFVRAFHLAKDKDRGFTAIQAITDQNGLQLEWSRPANHPDLVDVHIKNPIYPGQKFKLALTYQVKIPDARFTNFGFDDKDGSLNLKDWFLTPARIDGNTFVKYSNENLDDIANALCDFELTLTAPRGARITSDLYIDNKTEKDGLDEFYLIGKGRTNFNLVIESRNSFDVYHNGVAEVSCNLKDNRTTDIQQAILIDQIVEFTHQNLGHYPHGKALVTQADYERSPMYGLNQLPSFMNPYPDAFMFEMRFLKTYTSAILKNTLKLDPRKDGWLYDAMQMQLMMKYIEEFHPGRKMMGQLSLLRVLQGYKLFQMDFNEQYDYLSLLMARRNADQPIGDSKDTFIKFNEQIAGKYKAGLGFKYLDAFIGDSIVAGTSKQFFAMNAARDIVKTNREDYEILLKSQTDKDIDWFFETFVGTREIIDYKISDVDKAGDSLKVTVTNRTGADAPIPLYALDKDNVVIFREWLQDIKADSTFTVPRQGVDRLALNYRNEVPEFNTRNNWRPIGRLFPNKRPIKLTFFQDVEDPRYNQLFFVPSFTFNIYDGFSPGLRFHNKSLLEKPFIFDIEPTYSLNTGELIGSASLVYNHYLRDENLYSIRYAMSGSTFHYAPDARYTKFTPSIQFRIREDDLRENKRQTITMRNVLVDRENSDFVATENQNESYSVFNVRYSKYESEITRHYNFFTDVQLSKNFGKFQGEVQFRRLFNDNRQINLRLFAGLFMYRSTNSEFFSFGLDRPSDYMFDYNYYGRSETSGLFSQQFIMAEGGFKSKFSDRFANKWMTTVNASFNIWNWIEVYGDAGFFENDYESPKFLYDSGIRLNLVPDYFELYFPVQSSNGFELGQRAYPEKIRFVVTISPGTLLNLFKRKWF